MSTGLTEEQRKHIEENKRKALAKRTGIQGQISKESKSVPKVSPSPSSNTNLSRYNHSITATTASTNYNQRNPFIHKPTSQPSNASLQSKAFPVSSPHTAKTNDERRTTEGLSVSERIEVNRLKALAKRAEKGSLSPPKESTNGNYEYKSNNASSVQSAGQTQAALTNNFYLNHGKNDPPKVGQPLGSSNFGTNRPRLRTGGGLPSHSQSSYNHVSFSDINATSGANGNTKGGNLSGQTTPVGASEVVAPMGGRNLFSGVGLSNVKGSCLLVSRDMFEVSVGYSAPLLEIFKYMGTKQYDAVSKKWSFKLEEYSKLMSMIKPLKPHVEIDPLPSAILQVFSKQLKGDYPEKTVPIADLSRVDSSLVNSLMSFQREGVDFSIHKNGRVLIADDMGLGKTIQAICLACYYRNEWPLLIVVPSSVRFDWAQQFKRWVPSLDPQEIHVAVTGKDSCRAGLVNILSYDLMARKSSQLTDAHYQVVIMDECHLLKNHKTSRCKAAMPLLQSARRVILLSGTPALSRPSELYTQIRAVSPFLFKHQDFGVRYCEGKQMPWGWDFSGSSNMSELQIVLEEKIMIRRLKKDVLKELPDKVRQMVLLDPSSIKVNKDLKRASKVVNTSSLKGMEQRGALLDYFHESARAKMKAIRQYISDLLEGDKKFLVFAHHQEVLDCVEDLVKAVEKDTQLYIRIDGRTSSEQRNLFCHKFQNNDHIRVAILSITAANAGINLCAANLVVFAELFWNPGILVQAEDRAHRMGQQGSVSVHYLVAQNTSDDHIWPMIQKKLDVLGKAGLTKDDFSSANTTTVKDTRQQEIIQFLEESFSEDTPEADDNLDDEDSLNATSKKKQSTGTCKQVSIDKYLSPTKDLPPLKPRTPPKQKERGLFKYFSPSKKENEADESEGHTSERSRTPEVPDKEGQSSEVHVPDDDLDMLLDDAMDDWEEAASSYAPSSKKCRT